MTHPSIHSVDALRTGESTAQLMIEIGMWVRPPLKQSLLTSRRTKPNHAHLVHHVRPDGSWESACHRQIGSICFVGGDPDADGLDRCHNCERHSPRRAQTQREG